MHSRLFPALLILLLIVSSAVAQTGDQRTLFPGQPVDGTLDETNVAQIYTLTGTAGDTAALTLDSQTPGLALTLVLSNSRGNILHQLQITDDTPEEATKLDFAFPQAGTYYATVFATANAATTPTGTFTLALEITGAVDVEPPATDATITFTPGQASLLNGIEVSLRWQTKDDLNLQIRDPLGETLFWDSRSTSSGGVFGPDVNGLCQTLTEPPAVETAAWPGGIHATGSYEILVYYRQACEGYTPVDFTVDVTVDGVPLTPITGTLQPPVNNISNVYIAAFHIQADGGHFTVPGGQYTDTRVLPIPAQDFLALPATPITLEQTVQGVIVHQQPWLTYTFNGEAGDVVEVSMSKTVGSLDTLVIVLDSAGNIIDANDDMEFATVTDSLIDNLRLPTTNTYTIIATRYGKDFGGTEGIFELRVGAPARPTELLNMNLPSGDIEVMLAWSTGADLQLSVRDPFGNIVYDDVPRVQSGGVLEATGNINCTPTTGDTPFYFIYWPEGLLRQGTYEVEVWYQSECGDATPVTLQLYTVVNGQLLSTETYGIQWNERYLTNFTVFADGSARMGLGGILRGSDAIDHFSGRANAYPISSGDVVTGSITTENAYNLYTFSGTAGDVVSVSMNQTSGTLDTLLFIIDPNGVEIAANDDANESTNSLISDLVLTQTGEYIIIATHFGTIYGGTVGGYELAFRITR